MKLYGLIGYPLKNTFSEQYFNGKFFSLGLPDYAYRNFPMESIQNFPDFIQSTPNLLGLNITIPHKEQIIPLLTRLDESALGAGAVNCVKINGPETIGYNTDVYGFEESLKPFIANQNISGALILGNGGAAKAVRWVLNKLKIQHITVTRSSAPDTVLYSDLNAELMNKHNLIINCTPAGMFPDIDGFPPIPYELVTPQHLAYDLIYLPVETQFLSKCKQQGAITKNGLEMLHLQAERSWEIWFRKG